MKTIYHLLTNLVGRSKYYLDKKESKYVKFESLSFYEILDQIHKKELFTNSDTIFTTEFRPIKQFILDSKCIEDTDIKEMIIFNDGSIGEYTTDYYNDYSTILKTNQELSKSLLSKGLEIYNDDNYKLSICKTIAIQTLENESKNLDCALYAQTANSKKIYTNEYEIIKSLIHQFPYVGEVYCISKEHNDQTTTITQNINDLIEAKTLYQSIKTQKEFIINTDDKYIEDYNPEYYFYTTNNFKIFRDDEGFHIWSISVNPDEVSFF